MTDESTRTEEVEEPDGSPPVMTAAGFDGAQVNQLLANVDIVECAGLTDILGTASDGEGLQEDVQQALAALQAICTFHLRVDDKSTPYGPMWVADGRRSLIPEDFRGEQSAILGSIASAITHPGLRARVADVAWLNDLKSRAYADAAIDGYCDTVEAVLNGKMKHRFENGSEVSLRSVDYLKRAYQIAARTRKASDAPPRLGQLLANLLDRAEKSQSVVAFTRLAELAFQTDLYPAADLAKRAETFAATGDANAMVLRPAYQLAAHAYDEAKDVEAAHRCRLAGAELLVSMADSMGSAAAASHWLMDAIKEFRTIKGTKDRRKELEVRLREVQRDALDELGSFSTPIDLKPLAQGIEQAIEGLSLSATLDVVARLAPPRTSVQLRESARRSLEIAPLSSMFGAIHLDQDGKVTAKAPAASMTQEPDDAWYEQKICQEEKLHRQLVVAGQFEVARRTIAACYSISERHFMPIAEYSPFVPTTHQYLFALGFARLFQGDSASAAHLLIPQLENSIRFVLQQHGSDPTLIQSDMIQEDRSLSTMLEKDRSVLDAIFGEALVGEIDRLFNSRVGPAIRHDWAHGKLGLGHCLGADVVFACWLIFSIACRPLMGAAWTDTVGPAIDAEAS